MMLDSAAFDRPLVDEWVPRGGATAGRLELVSGAAQLTIAAWSGGAPYRDVAPLLHARAAGRELVLDADPQSGTVRVHDPRGPFVAPRPRAAFALAPALPWTIAIAGGAADVDADLRAVRLAALEIAGGASGVTLRLGRAAGIVPIAVRGGCASLRILRPADVTVVVQLRGGVTDLRIDSLAIGSLASDFTWRSPPGQEPRADRYEIVVENGASGVHVLADA